MKRHITHHLPSALLVFVLLASCTKQGFDHPAPDGGTPPDEPQRIRLEITSPVATPSTRVSTSTDGQYACSFSAGDRVGLYIVKGDAALQSSGNWVDNALLTYDGAKWSYRLPDGREYFPRDGSKLSFYAYYPYNAQLANPLDMSITVPSDQSTALASAYLMTAAKTGVSRSHNPVPLVFSNKLALVKVNLKNGTQPKDIAPRPADVVTLKGRQLTTTLNLATDAVSNTSGAATDVRMHYNTADKCWYALVPSQGVAAGSGLLTFEWTAITTLNHKAGTGFNLPAGEVKPLDITINANMTIDPNHVYAVGDAYPYVGFDKKGVVFEVSNGGKSGKIFSLNYKNELVWSTENVITNANSTESGRLNMETIRTRDNTFNKYPAFKWVHELNPPNTTYQENSKGIWYIPGCSEMLPFYQNEQDVEKAAMTLKALNLNEHLLFNNDVYVWGSDERPGYQETRAYVFIPDTRWLSHTLKSDGYIFTWPIMAF